MPKQMKVLEDFMISEISAVDHPAQQHAKAVLMKRRLPPEQTKASTEIAHRPALASTEKVDRPSYTSAEKAEKDATAAFNKVVAEIQKRDRCTTTLAMTKARRERPDVFEKYGRLSVNSGQYETTVTDEEKKEAWSLTKRAQAESKFLDFVHDAMQYEGLSKLKAMAEVRKRHPGLAADAYEGVTRHRVYRTR